MHTSVNRMSRPYESEGRSAHRIHHRRRLTAPPRAHS
jgi:hypothetical protein